MSSEWVNSEVDPYSYNNGDTYYYTNTEGNDTTYISKADCETAHSDGTCAHYHSGNYYNFSAVVASNNTASMQNDYTTMSNSICPKGWRLPTGRTNNSGSTNVNYYGDVNYTWRAQNIITDFVGQVENYGAYTENGSTRLSNNPLYMVRGNYYQRGQIENTGDGYYRTSTVANLAYGYTYLFSKIYPYPLTANGGAWLHRTVGMSARCVARQSSLGGSTTITFDKNAIAASGSMDTKTVPANTLANLPSNSFTRANYIFNGWNTESDGSGVNYNDKSVYYAAVGTNAVNLTLYAQWVPARTINIIADVGIKVSADNGANWTAIAGTTSLVVGEGQTIILKAKDDTPGYAFDYWSKVSGGGEFASTKWRSSSTKTTIFTVGSSDATIAANSTTVYTSIDSGGTPDTEDSTITTTMQNIDSCPDWLTIGAVYKLKDVRDDNIYYVSKLADGKCWMLDNLRLGSNSSMILNPNDTNISTNFTLPTGIENGYLFHSYSSPQISVTRKNDVASVSYGNGSGKIGTYYNYCAASAGTICTDQDIADANYDICPVHWRIPTGGTINILKGTGEYTALYKAYGNNNNFKNALSISFSGFRADWSPSEIDTSYYAWTSTFYSNTLSHGTIIRPSYMDFLFADYRYHGFSVRCLLAD